VVQTKKWFEPNSNQEKVVSTKKKKKLNEKKWFELKKVEVEQEKGVQLQFFLVQTTFLDY
jgi:hypothetical protein